MPSTPPAEPSGNAPAVPMASAVVIRPFTETEAKAAFENQPVARPVLQPSPDEGTPAIQLLDPGLKYKVKRETAFNPATTRIRWTPADQDPKGVTNEVATPASTTASVSAQMAQNVFEGFNATAVVIGHSKSGKATVMFGDMGASSGAAATSSKPAAAAAEQDGSDADGEAGDSAAPADLPDGAGLLPRFCNDLFAAIARKPTNTKTEVTVEVVGFDDNHTLTEMTAKKKESASGRSAHMDPEPLKVREEANGPVIAGSIKTRVTSASTMFDAVRHGYGRFRKFKARTSTHLVIAVRCTETMTFADPKSPSENITKTGYASATFTLMAGRPTAFFRCVDNAAARDRGENDKAKVPFRESSVTRLIQDLFGGNTYGYTFACIGPHFSTSKEAVVVLDLATKMQDIKTHPRVSYDETTTEFRRLDKEVSTLNSELSAAVEAHEVVQRELDSRQQALQESRRVYTEQSIALEDLRESTDCERMVMAIKKARLAHHAKVNAEREQALADEISEAEETDADLAAQVAALEAELVATEAKLADEQAVVAGLDERRVVGSAEIKRQEKRYEEVALSKQGLGAVKVKVESDHAERVGTKEADAATMRTEADDLTKKTEDMQRPLRIAQMASDSLASLRKRVETAKAKEAALADEEKSLPGEIDALEKEVAQMEIDAKPEGCCVVM